MQIFRADDLDELTQQAKDNSRLRQHRNIHQSFLEPCQRLFNAIEPGSYIRPHRHSVDAKDELLIAIRGEMALVLFNEQGALTETIRFGSQCLGRNIAAGAEVPACTWHTVIALEPGCVLLEVKAGPFDPTQPKDPAPWAPEEGSPSAQSYLADLVELIGSR